MSNKSSPYFYKNKYLARKKSLPLFEKLMENWDPVTENPLEKKLPVFKGAAGREKLAGYSLVDEDVYKVWSKIKWLFNTQGYVIANYNKANCRRLGIPPPENKKNLTLTLHRCVLGLGHSVAYKGDHINGNIRDNRKINLRLATDKQNSYNKNKINNVNGLIGVKKMADSYKHTNGSVYKRKKTWVAAIEYEKKYISRYFHTKEEASWYRDLMAVDLFGEFASLNHPENLEDYKNKLHTLHYK